MAMVERNEAGRCGEDGGADGRSRTRRFVEFQMSSRKAV